MSKLCLVSSSGGHLFELYSLKAFWGDKDRFWVTFPGPDTDSLLRGEKVYHGHYPTNRSIKNFIRNIFLAFKILRRERPDVVISTGAGIGASFICAARAIGVKTVYIESFAFTKELSLTGRIVYFLVDHFLVQWPGLELKYKNVEFKGAVL